MLQDASWAPGSRPQLPLLVIFFSYISFFLLFHFLVISFCDDSFVVFFGGSFFLDVDMRLSLENGVFDGWEERSDHLPNVSLLCMKNRALIRAPRQSEDHVL